MIRYLVYFIPFLLLLNCKSNVAEQKEPVKKEIATFKYVHEVRLPKTPSNNPPLLVLLHGLGSNEKDLFSFAQYLDPRLVVVSPRAPIVIGNNAHSWFDLKRGNDGWTYDIKTVKQSSEDVLDYIDQLVKEYKVDPSKVFIGGFSQGAIMSLTAGLTHPDKIKGIVCLSGRLYPELKQDLSNIKDFADLEIFISHGKQDQVLPYSDIVSDSEFIMSLGLAPTIKYYDTAHTISQDNFRDMVQWISSKLD